jgi:hypothetical protein
MWQLYAALVVVLLLVAIAYVATASKHKSNMKAYWIKTHLKNEGKPVDTHPRWPVQILPIPVHGQLLQKRVQETVQEHGFLV